MSDYTPSPTLDISLSVNTGILLDAKAKKRKPPALNIIIKPKEENLNVVQKEKEKKTEPIVSRNLMLLEGVMTPRSGLRQYGQLRPSRQYDPSV